MSKIDLLDKECIKSIKIFNIHRFERDLINIFGKRQFKFDIFTKTINKIALIDSESIPSGLEISQINSIIKILSRFIQFWPSQLQYLKKNTIGDTRSYIEPNDKKK